MNQETLNSMLPPYDKIVPQARYRISHPDPLNWCIEEWQSGGDIISRGRYTGQEKIAKWKAPECFYPSLRHAALALIDKAAGDAVLAGEASTILEAIALAEQRVLATLAVADMGVGMPTPAKTFEDLSTEELKEAGFKCE